MIRWPLLPKCLGEKKDEEAKRAQGTKLPLNLATLLPWSSPETIHRTSQRSPKLPKLPFPSSSSLLEDRLKSGVWTGPQLRSDYQMADGEQWQQ